MYKAIAAVTAGAAVALEEVATAMGATAAKADEEAAMVAKAEEAAVAMAAAEMAATVVAEKVVANDETACC